MRRFALIIFCVWCTAALLGTAVGTNHAARADNVRTVAVGGGRAAPPAAPSSVRVTGVGASWVSLRWRPVPGARSYQVLRNGTLAATTRQHHLRIGGLPHATYATWRVRSISGSGALSSRSLPTPVTTRVPTRCTLHVAASGSNTHDGTAEHPLRTIAAALARAGAGDAICLSGAFTEDVTMHAGGTRRLPLVLRSEPGTMATVRGRMWIADDADDVVVQGLRINGRNLDGGELPSPTIEGDRVRLIANDITNNRHHICVIVGSIRGYGIARDLVMDGNRIHDCGRRPGNNHQHGVYIEQAYNTRIVNNVIAANADRGIQLYPSAQDSVIARNVIVGNGEGLIFSGAEGYASSGNRVTHNVVTHSRTRFNIEYWWPDGNPIGTGNIADNNCVWGGAWGNLALPEVGYSQRNNVTADPVYRNRSTGDFRPTSHSGCRHLLLGTALPLLTVNPS